MTKKYGAIDAPGDIKLPGTPVEEGELFFPDVDQLPDDEPIRMLSLRARDAIRIDLYERMIV